MRRRRARSGFTLLEMSIVLAIIAVIVGGAATLFSAWLQKQQLDVTKARLAAIQQALYSFRIAYNRLPCPADQSRSIADRYFGIEAQYPDYCFMGFPSVSYINFEGVLGQPTSGSNVVTNISGGSGISSLAVGMPVESSAFPMYVTFISSINVGADTVTLTSQATSSWYTGLLVWTNVEGMVPTKTLGLPDDYAFDGWGRRIMYAVDVGFTKNNAFTTIPATDTSTRMTIKDASGNAKTTHAGYVLISFGPNGHGATPRNGGWTLISSGSINADELTNCGCPSNASMWTITGTFVQKPPTQDPTKTDHTDDFDDIVVYGTRSDLRSPNE